MSSAGTGMLTVTPALREPDRARVAVSAPRIVRLRQVFFSLEIPGLRERGEGISA